MKHLTDFKLFEKVTLKYLQPICDADLFNKIKKHEKKADVLNEIDAILKKGKKSDNEINSIIKSALRKVKSSKLNESANISVELGQNYEDPSPEAKQREIDAAAKFEIASEPIKVQTATIEIVDTFNASGHIVFTDNGSIAYEMKETRYKPADSPYNAPPFYKITIIINERTVQNAYALTEDSETGTLAGDLCNLYKRFLKSPSDFNFF